MFKILSKIILLSLFILLSGCKDIVEIKGNSEVYITHTYTYTANIVNPEIKNIDSYRWSVTPKKDVELIDAHKKNVKLKVLKEGYYKLHLIATKNSKKFPTHIDIKAIKPIYIDGFLLPHEVDETLNDSTLLGIDDNNNSIRDDVERWILLDMNVRYGNSKAERAIAMAKAKAYHMTLIDPTNKDDKVNKMMSNANDCRAYYIYVKHKDKKSYATEQTRIMNDKYFNTKERLRTYIQYDNSLRGRVFTKTPTRDYYKKCDEQTYNAIEGL